MEIVEHDFGQVAQELRAAAAELLGDSQVLWDFQWRQGLIAHELIAVAGVGSGRPAQRRGGHRGRELVQRHARMAGSVAVNLAHHLPVPVTIVP